MLLRATTVRTLLLGLGILVAWGGLAPSASAQMVTQGSPFNSAGHSFYENFGVGWGLSRGPSRNFGGFQLNVLNGGAAPQFGGFQPGGGLQTGMGFGLGNGTNGFFNFTAGQGSTRTLVNQTPVITTMNGMRGFVFDGAQSPFVISVIPVVGDGAFEPLGAANSLRGRYLRGEFHFGPEGEVVIGPPPPQGYSPRAAEGDIGPIPEAPAMPPPRPAHEAAPDAADDLVIRRPAATPGPVAETLDPFVADRPVALEDLTAMREQVEKQALAQAQSLFDQGQAAEARGRMGAARMYYRMALKEASGELHSEIASRLAAIE